jgi:hypothetical protein
MAPFFGFSSPMNFKIILPTGEHCGIYRHDEEFFRRGVQIDTVNGPHVIDRIIWKSVGEFHGVIHVIDLATWESELREESRRRRMETIWHIVVTATILSGLYFFIR